MAPSASAAPRGQNRGSFEPMADHLRFAGLGFEAQCSRLAEIIRAEPTLMRVLTVLRDEALPGGLLVAGAIYNTVWNILTGRPALHGVKDIDVFYFDDTDLSYEAEDAVIRRYAGLFDDLPLPVEIRNQARVHLWFPEKFGQPLAPLGSSEEMLGLYASKTHAVGCRLNRTGDIDVVAPFGLDDIFSFRIVPNRVLPANSATHASKARRAQEVWPEITVEAW